MRVYETFIDFVSQNFNIITLNFIWYYRYGTTILTAKRMIDAKKFRFFLFCHLFQIVANASNGNNSTSTNPVGNQPKTHSPSKWFLFHFSIILHLHLTFKLDDLLVTIRWLIGDESLDLPWFGCKGLQNKIIPHIF